MRGSTPEDSRMHRVRLACGAAAVEIAPMVGGRVSGLEVDGWDLVRRDGWTDNEWGIFVMAPWVGRLRDARVAWEGRVWDVPANDGPHALHGLVSATPWSVAAQSERSVRLETPFGPAWPTGGRLVHTITLAEDRLVMRLDLQAGREATPAIVGWHPWFRRHAVRVAEPGPGAGRESGGVVVEIAAQQRVELDDAGLPTGTLGEPGNTPLDDVLLGVTLPPSVRWQDGGPRLSLHAPGAAAWIVYTVHPDGVCVEPVTGIPDGINGGLLGPPPVAMALAPISATFEIAWA